MKLGSKIAVGAALLGAMSTTVKAESITFGVEIPPIASINVTQGLVVTANALRTDLTAITPANSPFVGAFTVNTNMPKWNVYFSLGNNGNLVDVNGNYLKDNTDKTLPLGVAANATVGTTGNLWLKMPAASGINGNDGAGTPLAYDLADAAHVVAAADGVVSNTATGNTLTAVLTASVSNTGTCNGPAVCTDDGWVHATSPTLTTFGLGTGIDDTDPVNAIAGTYTETLYLTLVTAY